MSRKPSVTPGRLELDLYIGFEEPRENEADREDFASGAYTICLELNPKFDLGLDGLRSDFHLSYVGDAPQEFSEQSINTIRLVLRAAQRICPALVQAVEEKLEEFAHPEKRGNIRRGWLYEVLAPTIVCPDCLVAVFRTKEAGVGNTSWWTWNCPCGFVLSRKIKPPSPFQGDTL